MQSTEEEIESNAFNPIVERYLVTNNSTRRLRAYEFRCIIDKTPKSLPETRKAIGETEFKKISRVYDVTSRDHNKFVIPLRFRESHQQYRV